MHPILIDLGFFQVPTYGVMLAIAVAAGLWTARRRAISVGIDGDRLVDFGLWLVIWALIGSKLLLVVVELPQYLAHPERFLSLFRAGGVFLGGFMAAVVAAVVLLKRYKLPPLPSFDAMAPSISLGQAIGRVGCFAAGCCWGGRCDLPWSVVYTNPAAAANVGTPLHQHVHPWPLYAVAANLVLFLILELYHRRRPTSGRVFGAYLVLYGVTRFILERWRGDEIRGDVLWGWLSTSQGISIGLIACGVGLQVWLSRRGRD
jgi:phosphatidylglycerol:prolipoprotein diacylglycerol transferase